MGFLDNAGARLRHLSTAAVVVVVFAAGFAMGNQYSIGAAQGPFTPPAGTEEQFAAFWQVYNLIQNDYVDPEGDELDQQQLVDGAIQGMISSLDDEFSGYMDAEMYPLLNQDLEGEIEGIGVVIRTVPETNEIEVVSVLEGSPAESVGILPGDVFARVDGQDVSLMNQTELATLVRGPIDSMVELTMRRGDDLIDFTVTRARIVVPNIEADRLEDNIGYIKLNQFGPQARQEVEDALSQLDSSTLEGLIFDLRGNPGGLLTTSVDVASMFIPEGVVLYEDFGGGSEQVFNVTGNYLGLDMPIVVLVDETSASASELVAGAMQDHDVATIIGERTFGKGTVQTWQSLINGGGVRLTIARWLTPDRNWIHAQGVTPDIIVEWNPQTLAEEPDLQLDAALDYFRGIEIAGQNTAS